MKNTIYTIEGNVDLLVVPTCTLHCENCSLMDFRLNDNEPGIVSIKGFLMLSDIEEIMNKLTHLQLFINELSLMGGEPTLHPEFDQIVDCLNQFKNKVFKFSRVNTNGTLLTTKIIDSFCKLDEVIFSFYPCSLPILKKIKKTGLLSYLKKHTKVQIWRRKKFGVLGLPKSYRKYSKEINYKRCWAKDRCRELTKEGLYRCYVLQGKKQDLCKMENQEEVINYLNRPEPFDLCEHCPQPPLEVKWKSLMPEQDKKTVQKAIENIDKIVESLS